MEGGVSHDGSEKDHDDRDTVDSLVKMVWGGAERVSMGGGGFMTIFPRLVFPCCLAHDGKGQGCD